MCMGGYGKEGPNHVYPKNCDLQFYPAYSQKKITKAFIVNLCKTPRLRFEHAMP